MAPRLAPREISEPGPRKFMAVTGTRDLPGSHLSSRETAIASPIPVARPT